MYPGRKNPLFTEDGIRAAIQGNLEEIETGLRPEIIRRPRYQPYKKHPKYTGIMALYAHYLYVLGKIEERQYSPRMTPKIKAEVMKFERYREQFAFLRENGLSTQEDIAAFQAQAEDRLSSLTKQRTILNVRKKKRRSLYTVLADAAALAQAKAFYEEGLSGMETEFSQYMEAVSVLERCGIPQEWLAAEKAELYEQLAQVNSDIRAVRKELAMCQQIQSEMSHMDRDIQKIEDERNLRDQQRSR